MPEHVFLVTGATGAQGGATARQLLAAGRRVRILTRDPGSATAQALVALGAEAVRGDFDDTDSVRAAMMGATGVFSMQNPGPLETAHGLLLVREALRAGVQHFVHTSVTGTTGHRRFPDWGTGRWTESYWLAKWEIEEAVRAAGFPHHTVLRPAFMMENFIPPKVDFLFPALRHGEIATAIHIRSVLQLVSAEDVGAFATAAFTRPQDFNGCSIDLACENPTVSQIADTLSRGLQRKIRAVALTPDEALARGQFAGWVRTQEWINEVGYQASIEALGGYGIRLTTFADWVAAHRDAFRFDPAPSP